MSIIQKIREKAAWLVFIVIALSLIGFLLMDAFGIGIKAVAGRQHLRQTLITGYLNLSEMLQMTLNIRRN